MEDKRKLVSTLRAQLTFPDQVLQYSASSLSTQRCGCGRATSSLYWNSGCLSYGPRPRWSIRIQTKIALHRHGNAQYAIALVLLPALCWSHG